MCSGTLFKRNFVVLISKVQIYIKSHTIAVDSCSSLVLHSIAFELVGRAPLYLLRPNLWQK